MALFQSITIHEIGEKAGVSIATVSRALNGSGPVRDTTMQKIRDAMEALGYQMPAQKQQRTGVLLASVPDMTNPFSSAVVRGISDAAEKRNYRTAFYVNDSYDFPASYSFLEDASFFDGLILAHTLPDESVAARLAARRPTVLCTEPLPGCALPYVAIDDFEAARSAANYLISMGRKKIACINSSLANQYARRREQGFRASMKQAGLPVREEWVLHLPAVDFDVAYGSLAPLFEGTERPDALFCVSDVYAASAIRYAAAHGIRVPRELSVLGFDDIPLASMLTPAITTIRQPAYQMGVQACSLLIEQIEHPSTLPSRMILNTDLIVRGST